METTVPFSEGCSEVSRHAGVGVTRVTCGRDHECTICALIPQVQENFYIDLRTVQTIMLSSCYYHNRIYNHPFLFKGNNNAIDAKRDALKCGGIFVDDLLKPRLRSI